MFKVYCFFYFDGAYSICKKVDCQFSLFKRASERAPAFRLQELLDLRVLHPKISWKKYKSSNWDKLIFIWRTCLHPVRAKKAPIIKICTNAICTANLERWRSKQLEKPLSYEILPKKSCFWTNIKITLIQILNVPSIIKNPLKVPTAVTTIFIQNTSNTLSRYKKSGKGTFQLFGS